MSEDFSLLIIFLFYFHFHFQHIFCYFVILYRAKNQEPRTKTEYTV